MRIQAGWNFRKGQAEIVGRELKLGRAITELEIKELQVGIAPAPDARARGFLRRLKTHRQLEITRSTRVPALSYSPQSKLEPGAHCHRFWSVVLGPAEARLRACSGPRRFSRAGETKNYRQDEVLKGCTKAAISSFLRVRIPVAISCLIPKP